MNTVSVFLHYPQFRLDSHYIIVKRALTEEHTAFGSVKSDISNTKKSFHRSPMSIGILKPMFHHFHLYINIMLFSIFMSACIHKQ
jgi:hypothetical protein